MDFCLWSYIIFSTMLRVSLSRSDSWGQAVTEMGEALRHLRPHLPAEAPQLVRAHLGVLRIDLLGVDLRVTGNQAAPPLHLVDLKGREDPQRLGVASLWPGNQPQPFQNQTLSLILHLGPTKACAGT